MTWGQQLSLSASVSPSVHGCLCLTPGSRLTLQDLASFQPEVVDALAVPLGDYTLYSPPPPAGGAILSFILNVLKGKAPGLPWESCPAANQPLPLPAWLEVLKPGLWEQVKMCSGVGLWHNPPWQLC